ncbi:unnamed protein product, partial [Urochloa humidicola]
KIPSVSCPHLFRRRRPPPSPLRRLCLRRWPSSKGRAMPPLRRFFQFWSSSPHNEPTPTTASMSTMGTAQGRHLFEINGYSKHRGMGHDKFVRSRNFSVGGYSWSIRFYPDGFTKETGHISVYLELMSQGTKVRASCDLNLINQSMGLPSLVHRTELRVFNSSDVSKYAPDTSLFKKRSELEASGYIQDDRLVIECIVTVITEVRVSETKLRRLHRKIEMPPSDIAKCLGKLLEAEEGADITFSVAGETFAAHKLVLAMRSPVFKAELYGPMKEGSAQLVTIEDMQPAVFRALLHFIYTDSLPDTNYLGRDASCEM